MRVAGATVVLASLAFTLGAGIRWDFIHPITNGIRW
jgi:hypothetical protein